MPETPDAKKQRLEEIVAYLDGELSSEASARVERLLASDELFRRDLQSVERAWAALDELPQVTVDDKFSRTTMELAVEAASQDVQQRTIALPRLKTRRRLATALATITAAALGFLAIRLAWQNPNRLLVDDLPAIENIDIYSQFQDVDFLRNLRKELGDQFPLLSGNAESQTARANHLQAVEAKNERPDWLGNMSEEEKTKLRAKYNRFRELPTAEQQRLRDLDAQIAAAPDAPQLRETMAAYEDWLGGLPPAKQFELRSLPPDRRIDTVREWARGMRDEEKLTLTEEELKKLFRDIRGPLADLKPPPNPEGVPKNDAKPRQGRVGPLGENILQMNRVLLTQFATGQKLRSKLYDAILQALPERTRDAFEELTPQQKVARLFTWRRQVSIQAGEVSQQELEQFFAEELDPAVREKLLALPPDKFEQALKQFYNRQPGAGFQGFWGGGPRGEAGPRQGGRWLWDDMPRPGRGDRPRDGFGQPADYGPPPPDGEGFNGPGDNRGFGPPPPGEPRGPGSRRRGPGPPPRRDNDRPGPRDDGPRDDQDGHPPDRPPLPP